MIVLLLFLGGVIALSLRRSTPAPRPAVLLVACVIVAMALAQRQFI